MKSERAKKYIDNDAIVMRNGDRMVDASTAYMAIELAEQDAEQRMRQKAVEAFKSSCEYKDGCGGIGRDCHPVLCEDLRSFIQKLNDDEND